MPDIAMNAWPAVRIVHLLGGCRIFNGQSPQARLMPVRLSGRGAMFDARSYRTLYRDIHSLGLTPIGVDFYSHQLQADGKEPPDWRPYSAPTGCVWACDNATNQWSQISHAAFKSKMANGWDLAGRITYQLRALSWRLRQTSEAYHIQLTTHLASGGFKESGKFDDGFSAQIYLALHSSLIDACILRDYLAEFLAQHVFRSASTACTDIRTMAALRKKVLNNIKGENALAATLWRDTDYRSGGWLARLGAYRDLVVHASPLAHAGSRLFVCCRVAPIKGEEEGLPTIHCPIPQDPMKIAQSRATARHFKSFDEMFRLYTQTWAQRDEGPDGLSYIWDAVARLSSLAIDIADASPIRPVMPSITEEDLIGPITVKK